MANIDYFQLLKMYLHSAMNISVPKSKKMSYIFSTPGDLWLNRGWFKQKRSKHMRPLGGKPDLRTYWGFYLFFILSPKVRFSLNTLAHFGHWLILNYFVNIKSLTWTAFYIVHCCQIIIAKPKFCLKDPTFVKSLKTFEPPQNNWKKLS